MNIQRWQQSVVNLECAGNRDFILNRIVKLDETIARYRKGQLSFDTFLKTYTDQLKNRKYVGTALLITHGGNTFFLTSKRLVVDEVSIGGKNDVPHPFKAIFVIPSLQDYFSDTGTRPFELNLRNEPDNLLILHPEMDLALIKLDRIADSLQTRFRSQGMDLLSKSDIDERELQVGTELSTVGFPGNSELVIQNELLHKEMKWASSYYSLPVWSFGKVAMNLQQLNYFWADMNLYVGNSGSPVMANGKIIGMVSGQTIRFSNGYSEAAAAQHFNGVIKGKFLSELLTMTET